MADNPNQSKEVKMSDPAVKQHKQMAAGIKITGQSLPSAPKPDSKPKA